MPNLYIGGPINVAMGIGYFFSGVGQMGRIS
jgi:hypothetical protein